MMSEISSTSEGFFNIELELFKVFKLTQNVGTATIELYPLYTYIITVLGEKPPEH